MYKVYFILLEIFPDNTLVCFIKVFPTLRDDLFCVLSEVLVCPG